MLLFIIFCPIVAAILIMAGAPARKTALVASILTLITALIAFVLFERDQGGFQYVSSFTISPEWKYQSSWCSVKTTPSWAAMFRRWWR